MTRGLSIALLALSLLATGIATHAAAQEEIGETTVVVRDVTGLLGQNLRRLAFEDSVYFREAIESGADSATEIEFVDGTTLTIGPNTRITLDEVVFDPDPGESKFVLTVTKGILRLATGELPSEAYSVNTPVATIGVRGTVLNVVVASQ